jgi:hypothetical protein
MININNKSAKDLKKYRTVVMQIVYIARMSRNDLLFATSILATKINNPSIQDEKNLLHLLKYINGTQNYGILLNKSNNNNLNIYCDASHAIHNDKKSHTGIVIK